MLPLSHAPSGGRALLTWGRATHGQLGHGRKQRADVAVPTAVAPLAGHPVVAVACGHFHTAVVVVVDGRSTEVHTWGRGALGLLGHGDEEDTLVPRPVGTLAGMSVRAVACGVYQTAALTERGELFSWGWRLERSASGEVVEGYSTLPDKAHALAGLEVRHVACGHYCTAATTTDGALFTWGKGDRGQLGQGHTRDVVEPERVRGGALSGTFVWDARFGHHFMLALTAAGEICSCGAADFGVLGRAGHQRLLTMGGGQQDGGGAAWQGDDCVPRRVSGLTDVRASAIACGESHCAAIGSEGELYTWGAAAYGKLGHDSATDLKVPTPVVALHGKQIVEVACGAHTTIARDDGGQYACCTCLNFAHGVSTAVVALRSHSSAPYH